MIYLSVIIPVRNEAEHIAYTLNRLLEQNYDHDKLEILVVDGMSDDQTPQIVQEYVQKYVIIRYFENPKRLAGAARNIGIQNARGEAVLIVDGHCIIDSSNMLLFVSEAFEKSGADCLGRPQPLEMANATPLQWAIATARRSPLGHHPDSFIYSGHVKFVPASSVAVAYRKSVFEKVGYFDENFDAAEDVELNTRIDQAGLTCCFEPAIAVRYVPRKTFKALAYQMQRYGQGRVRLWRKHPHTFSWKSFAPGVFVAGVLCACLLNLLFLCSLFAVDAVVDVFGVKVLDLFLVAFVWSWYTLGIIFSVFFGLYLVIVLAESLRLSLQKKRLDILPFLPLVFFNVHVGYGWGILREFLFPKKFTPPQSEDCITNATRATGW